MFKSGIYTATSPSRKDIKNITPAFIALQKCAINKFGSHLKLELGLRSIFKGLRIASIGFQLKHCLFADCAVFPLLLVFELFYLCASFSNNTQN